MTSHIIVGRYVESGDSQELEAQFELALTENQEGRVCLSRLMIFAISAYQIPGDTRLHQIAGLLRSLNVDMSEDPELIAAILEEAEARAKNYQMFCAAPKDKVLSPESEGLSSPDGATNVVHKDLTERVSNISLYNDVPPVQVKTLSPPKRTALSILQSGA